MRMVRVSTLIAFTAAIASGTVLFVTSQRVQRAEHKVAQLKDQKVKEEDSIHVLRAEWDYLNRPDRLEALATQYLDMKQPDLASITANPKKLAEPSSQNVSTPLRPAPLMAPQPAVYRPSVPAPADQRSFQALLHDLNGGGHE